MLIYKKIRKLIKNPKLFFRDMKIKKEGKQAKQKSIINKTIYKANNKFTIVSAVYNVEKYLDDFFTSIINQSIGFERAIQLIMVDDGSTDNSANIIKRYQKQYPNNITYIYKENGGQASARNIGLKYIKTPWVTFCDPDDFLHFKYFEYIDRELNLNNNTAIIISSAMYFHEQVGIFKDTHSTKVERYYKIKIKDLDNIAKFNINNAVIKAKAIKKIKFEEQLIVDSSETKALGLYLLDNIEYDLVYLKDAKYYRRKQEDNNERFKSKHYYLLNLEKCYLKLLKDSKNKYCKIPSFIQQTIICEVFLMIKYNINNKLYLTLFNNIEIESIKKSLFNIFKYIKMEEIVKSNYENMWFFHKIGMAQYFKNNKLNFDISYVTNIDYKKNKMIIEYFSENKTNDVIVSFSDGKNIIPYNNRYIKYDLFGETFIYKHICYFTVSNSDSFKFYKNNHRMMIGYDNYEFDLLKNQNFEDSWLFIGDNMCNNAECLYDYLHKNKLNNNIYFSLNDYSSDLSRLEKKEFNLVVMYSRKFYKVIKECRFLILDRLDELFLKKLKDILVNKKIVLLQYHNNIPDGLFFQNYLITAAVRLSYTDTQQYNLKYTGFAKHDKLIELNQVSKNENKIIFIPSHEHFSKEYEPYYNFLANPILNKLLLKFNYKLVCILAININIQNIKLRLFENNNIEFKNIETSHLQYELATCKALITDYSSIAFDIALINKPAIYYQINKNKFFNNNTYIKENFDYEKDGFGAIAETEDDLIKELEKLFKLDFKIEQKYQERINNTFTFRDGKCCERIYQEIIKL